MTRYVNTASTAGGDGTTNNTTGATRAFASLEEVLETGVDFSSATAETVVVKGFSFPVIGLEIICDNAGGDDTTVTGGKIQPANGTWTGLSDTKRVLVRAADNSWHTDLKFGTGYALKAQGGSSYGLIDLAIYNFCWAGLEIYTTRTGTYARAFFDKSLASTTEKTNKNTYFSCLFKSDGSDVNSSGFRHQSSVIVANCKAVCANGPAFQYHSSPNHVKYYANIAVDSVTGFNHSNASTSIIQNCVGFNNTTDFASSSGTGNSNNASSDTTAPGTSVQTSITTAAFADTSTDDYTPASGGALDDNGATISAISAVDANGNTRPQGTNWDIGPLELVTSSSGRIMGSLASQGGLAGPGGIAGPKGGLAG